MHFIDLKFIGMLSPFLEKFKVKQHNPYRANFRCPVCGDSEKSKNKARGWFFESGPSSVMFHCHNCGVSKNLKQMIETVNPSLLNEYVGERAMENMKSKRTETVSKHIFSTPKFRKGKSPLLKLKKISQLKPNHKARKYVDDRLIPVNRHFLLYHCPKFVEFTNSLLPGKFDDTFKEHSRLLIPIIDKDENFVGYQGRSYNSSSSLRYITIMLSDDHSKVFGLDRVDQRVKFYITEGPIDSLFLDNSVAMCGAELNFQSFRYPENGIVIFDNEPRNEQIVKKMLHAVSQNWSVCIWPDTIKSKDINGMIEEGLSSTEISTIIDNSTYKGLMAKLEIMKWKKIELS